MEKMTNVKALNYVIENAELPEEVVAKLTAMRDGFVKKAENKKPTKEQAENAEIKERIVAVVTEGNGLTATQVAEQVGITLHKATALLTALTKEERVKREVDKKKILFYGI